MRSLTLLMFILFNLVSFVDARDDLTQSWSPAQSRLLVSMKTVTDLSGTSIMHTTGTQPTVNYKNPKLGALMSAFVPGSGQMVAKSWIKGVLFIGAEVGLIMGYNHYRDAGDKLKADFRAFADKHWIEADYWVAMAESAGMSGVTTENYRDRLEGEGGLRAYERQNYSHQLHRFKDQQYYEMIGKYYQFEHGWDDFDPDLHKVSPNRAYYEDLEFETDARYKRAGTCGMIILANHLIAALDAAWTVNQYNKRIQIKPRMGVIQTPRETIPTTGFALNW